MPVPFFDLRCPFSSRQIAPSARFGYTEQASVRVLLEPVLVTRCAPPGHAVRKWWNWQTHHLEGVAPKGVRVQVPPSAPYILFQV
jgi:hypothetical protein